MGIIKLNKEGNTGLIPIEFDLVKSYYVDEESKFGGSIIEMFDGKKIKVADTLGQIELLLKWKAEGKIDNKGQIL